MRKKIEFLSECYKQDRSGKELWNLFSTTIRHLEVFDLNAVQQNADGHYQLVLPDDYGKTLQAAIEIFRRERTFLFGSCLIVGRGTTANTSVFGNHKISAPLVLFDGNVHVRESAYYLTIDMESFRWNEPVLKALCGDDDTLEQCLASVHPREALHTTFSENVRQAINTLTLYRPKSGEVTKTKLQSLARRVETNQYRLVEAVTTLTIENSKRSRGIIDELNQLLTIDDYSLPLKNVLNEASAHANTEHQSRPANFYLVPGLLSRNQKAVIESAVQNSLTTLIGPPGTGKSYTIASIVLERFLQGESVLVVSKSENAVDVVKEKLTDTFGLQADSVIRAGDKAYYRKLTHYIDSLLRRDLELENHIPIVDRLNALKDQISNTEQAIQKRFNTAINNGQFLIEYPTKGFWSRFVGKLRIRRIQKYLETSGMILNDLEQLRKQVNEKNQLLTQYIDMVSHNKISYAVKRHKLQIRAFSQALRAQSSMRQEQLFAGIEFADFMEMMPIWLCSLDTLHKVLPLKRQLFDLVIIDEATQCDIASCLPALYRAKRAVVVGDPKQLKHVSFVSRQTQQELMDKLHLVTDISYRDDSMLHLAMRYSPESTVLLDEHYRSVPEIIRFSNEYFYKSCLRVMTEKPHLQNKQPIEIIRVANGQRVKGKNCIEADALIDKLTILIQEQHQIPKEFKLSIGVVSFFREQADYIQDQIFQRFSLEDMMDHKLRAGTPYAFQGEERDIMLLSCGVDADSNASTYNYMNKDDVFNVTITRARKKQYTFLSCDVEELNTKSLLYKYLSTINQYTIAYSPKLSQRNVFIQDVCAVLHQQDVQVLMNYPIAGVEMDLVLVKDGMTLAINLIGFPDDEMFALALEHYKIFERAGLHIMPLELSAWLFRKEQVIQVILDKLVAIKDAETIERLTKAEEERHWFKLLNCDKLLAEQVKEIEDNILTLSLFDDRKLLGELIEQYLKTLWVLAERLEPTELTYRRYATTAEQVFLGVLANLNKIYTIFHGLIHSENYDGERADIRDEQSSLLFQLREENQKAVVSLEKIVMIWSKEQPKSMSHVSDISESLKDLDALALQATKYTEVRVD